MSSASLKVSYQSLDAESLDSNPGNDKPEETRHSKPRVGSRSISPCTLTMLLGAALAVALLALVAYETRLLKPEQFRQTRHSRSNTCGNSSSEALSLGCSFNQLMWTWHPKHCPLYANDDYLAAEPEDPWVFYVDPHTREVARDDDWDKMLNNEIGLFSEKGEHVTHCVFMYVALYRIFRDGGRHTEKYVDEEHLNHCSEMMLEMLRKDETWFNIDAATPQVSYSETC